MKQLAADVWQLRGTPPNVINVYLIDDVLIDAGSRYAGRRILRQLRDREVNAHALTHAHPDHQGSSHEVCEKLGIPYWVGENDVAAAEDPRLIGESQPNHPMTRFFARACTGPAHTVDRSLREGDEVGSFKVLDAPGHSPGHVAYWRESDRVLILGDVLTNINVSSGLPGLHEPKRYLTPDPARNRESARRLAKLEPTLVTFGHGAPLRDTRKFVEFVEALPT